MNINKAKYYFIFLIGLVLYSCVPYKNMQESEKILIKNKIRYIDSEHKKGDLDQLKNFIKQKPNKKLFYIFKFHLGVYTFAHNLNSSKHQKGLFDWMENTVGEKPVIYDSILSKASARQIKNYLFNKGYFNSVVDDTIQIRGIKNRKVKNIYLIQLNQPYYIRSVKYDVSDTLVSALVRSSVSDAIMKEKKIYDKEKLDNERLRIEKLLQNSGFYSFSRDYIKYIVDSSLNNHQVDIEIQINNKPVAKDLDYKHQKYKINKLYVDTDHDPMGRINLRKDTLCYKNVFFLYNDKINFKPKPLLKSIFIKPDSIYIKDNVEYTYQRISDLKTFRYINIYFEEVKDTINRDTLLLNCYIQLSPVKKQSYTFELEGTNSHGNLGITGNILYQHRNLFKGSELLNVKLTGAMEFQNVNIYKNKVLSEYLPFNTYEYGFETMLNIPQFMIPYRIKNNPETKAPKTNIITGYNYQLRPDYNRSILNIAYEYEWKINRNSSHFYSPLDYNYIRLDKDSLFNVRIIATGNPVIINSFKSHLIAGTKYNYVYNNQNSKLNRNFTYFRFNLELAGNILRGIAPILNFDRLPNNGYSLLNIRFAQYIRSSIDYRYYIRLNESEQLAIRQMLGMGIPYANNHSLPFEKSYFAGGANSMRGWRIYELGPGSYSDNMINTRIGDVQLETNIEYRHKLYKDFKGAIFIDAGNIWMLRKEVERPNAEFNFNRFYKEIALAGGYGFRYDFSFFIIRLDLAVKLKDPSIKEGSEWSRIRFKSINYNLAIGYPF